MHTRTYLSDLHVLTVPFNYTRDLISSEELGTKKLPVSSKLQILRSFHKES